MAFELFSGKGPDNLKATMNEWEKKQAASAPPGKKFKVTSSSIWGEVGYGMTVLVHYELEDEPPRGGRISA
jgi:hypothetical protein